MSTTGNPMDQQIQTAVLQYLDLVRREQGEDAWKAAVKKQVLQALQLGGTWEDFWRSQARQYEWLDLEQLARDAASAPSQATDLNTLLASTFRKRMPGMKTQAQFTTFRAAFDAFEAVVNSIFSSNRGQETEARKLLEMAFNACRQATDISQKLGEVPEAASSKASAEFKQPPAEFAEFDVQQALLGELAGIQTLEGLKRWYGETKERRDSIRSQTLRDVLIDAVRSRKLSLEATIPPAPEN